MSIDQVFYVLGSIVMGLLIIYIIAITVLSFMLYKKVVQMREQMDAKLASLSPSNISGKTFTKAGIATLIPMVLPLMIKGLPWIFRGKRRF